jgi:hypothetical protein
VSVGNTGKVRAAIDGDGRVELETAVITLSGGGGDCAAEISSNSSIDGNVCENSTRLNGEVRGDEEGSDVGLGGPSVDGDTKACSDDEEAVEIMGGEASCVCMDTGGGTLAKERCVGETSDPSESCDCMESRLERAVGDIGGVEGA